MKRDAVPVLTTVIRAVLIVSLLAFGTILLIYFLKHRSSRQEESQNEKQITAQKMELQEGVRYLEFKAEKGRFAVKAARHYQGADNKYYLEGEAEVRDFGRKGGREVFFSGDKIAYDKDWTQIFLIGRARVKRGDITVESEALAYDKNNEILKSDKKVIFSSKKVSGSSQKMTYFINREEVLLEGNVEIAFQPEGGKSAPLVVHGETFGYNRKEKKGVMERDVRFSLEGSEGQANLLNFDLSEDEQYVRTVLLQGSVRAHFNPPSSPSKKQMIEAEEIFLRTFLNMHKIHAVEAKGACLFKRLAPGQMTQVLSDSMNFTLDRWGSLREFRAQKNVSMVEKDSVSGLDRSIAGEDLFVNAYRETLAAKGGGRPASLLSGGSEISAQEITLDLKTGNLLAQTAVKAILIPGKEDKESIGFFSKGLLVFATAQEMRYSKEEERFIFNENVRIWQEKEMLFAKKVNLLKETGEISCEGEVKSIFPFKPKKEGAKEEKVEIASAKMSYQPRIKLIIYEENASLKAGDISLSALTLEVNLGEEKGEVKSVLAKGNVVVVRDIREGRGQEARYDLAEEKVVLTGNPRLEDKNKGILQGDKLTFYLADGRIIVENRERERSVTVIKSEK